MTIEIPRARTVQHRERLGAPRTIHSHIHSKASSPFKINNEPTHERQASVILHESPLHHADRSATGFAAEVVAFPTVEESVGVERPTALIAPADKAVIPCPVELVHATNVFLIF